MGDFHSGFYMDRFLTQEDHNPKSPYLSNLIIMSPDELVALACNRRI